MAVAALPDGRRALSAACQPHRSLQQHIERQLGLQPRDFFAGGSLAVSPAARSWFRARNFLAGRGADRKADAIILRERFNVVQIVAEVEVVPAIGVADGAIEFAVQVAQFEQTLVSELCFAWLLADLGNQRGRQVTRVEEVVDVGETEPEQLHEGLTLLMVALTDLRQNGVCRLPKCLREGEGFEAIRWGIAKSGFESAAVFPCPDFMQCGLYNGVKVPPVGGEDVQSVGVNVVG
jgi:hypothetical protein